MIFIELLIGAVVGIPIGIRATRSQARSDMRHELARSRAEMRREINHWQEAAARANAEAARIAREAEAFKAGCQSGREDVISIVPLLVAAQKRPADEARASGEQR